MKKIYLIYLLIFAQNLRFAGNCFTQAPDIAWQKTIGGSEYDWIQSIIATLDGGCLVGGYSASDISGNKTENSKGGDDYWIVKIDMFGEIQWQKSIGGDQTDRLTGMCLGSDGGYVLVGHSSSEISGDKLEETTDGSGLYDYWVLKINETGEIVWQNTIGGNDSELLPEIIRTVDGGYLIGGSSYSDASGDKSDYNFGEGDIWFVKINNTGEIEWENAYGSYVTDPLVTFAIAHDGGILAGSEKYDAWSGETEAWLIKFDSIGQFLWQTEYGGSWQESITSIYSKPSGNIMISLTSNSYISGDKTEDCLGFFDYWILELDPTGNIIWQNTIGGNAFDTNPYFIPTSDGGYIFSGTSESNISGDKTEDSFGDSDIWIVKTDSIGQIEWQKSIGGSDGDGSYGIIEVDTGIYIIGGGSFSNISGMKNEDSYGELDYWLLKIGCEPTNLFADSDGDLFGDYFKDTLICGTLANYVENNTDCDDTDPSIYPGSPEIFDGIDNNCNGELDEGFVSVLEEVNQFNITIFPNPNTGIFNLVYNFPFGAISPLQGGPRGVTLQIFNSLGQQIYSQELISSNGNINETISLHNLSSGIYFVRINNVQQKLIIE